MNASMKHWTMYLWIVMLAVLAMHAASAASPHATLSVLEEQDGIKAVLYGLHITSDPTITLIDDQGQIYILPGQQTSTTTWEAFFPIKPAKARLFAYDRNTYLASVTRNFNNQGVGHSTPGTDKLSFLMATKIRDSKGHLHDVNIKIRDKQQDELRFTQDILVELTKQAYRFEITPKQKTGLPVDKISFNDLVPSASFDLGIESVPPKDGYQKIYAIDPEALNFTNATVTVTASGTELYKCAAWNFTTQTCEGNWTLIKEGLTPGQQYNVTITRSDPAFGEKGVLAMEWGTIAQLNDTWQTIHLTYTYIDPVIVATPHYDNAGVPTVTRITNITDNSFAVRLQDTGGGTATTRNISYLVVEAGNWTLPNGDHLEATTYTSTTTDSDSDWTPDQRNYLSSYTNPVVIGQVMSYNDRNWSVFWASDGTTTGEPTSTNLYTAKHVGQDPNTARIDETIGYIVMEQGHDTIKGTPYDAELTADSVQGVLNSPPYNVAYQTSYSTAPTVAIASSAGMDGGNGGWPVTYGARTATTIGLACDEYDSGERSHTAEPVALVTFAAPGSYLANDPAVISGETFDPAQVEPTQEVTFNVTVTDKQGNSTVTGVNATFRYPNGTLLDVPLSQVAEGQTVTTPDQEANDITVQAQKNMVIGETGILGDVNSWTTITFKHAYTKPLVFAFTRNQSNIDSTREQALAIITNVTQTTASVAVIAPNNTFTTDDVGYVIMESGTYNVSGSTIQAGTWNYSGTSYTTKTFATPFATQPTVYLQLQNQTATWYTGRYQQSSLATTGLSIQYQDAASNFAGTAQAAYLAFEQGTVNDLFEGTVEAAVGEDPGSNDWRTVTFTNSHDQPIFLAILSEGGTDPAKVGIDSLNATGIELRTTEETVSDSEQNHAVDDVLWMVFNASQELAETNSTPDTDATITGAVYNDVDNTTMELLSSIKLVVDITNYSNAGSQANGNANPVIEAQLMTANGWKSIGTKAIATTGPLTWTVYDNEVLTDWQTLENRDVRLITYKMDHYNRTATDTISWDNVTLTIDGGTKTSTWRTLWQDTAAVGTYNITKITAYDSVLATNTTYTALSFTVADTTPPTFTKLANATFNTGQAISVEYDATDYSGIADWSINDSRFSIDNTGLLTNATTLSEGTYTLNLSVIDPYDNAAWTRITINLTTTPDTTPPVFIPALNETMFTLGIPFAYDVNATDDRGLLDNFWLNDTALFTINQDTGLITNTTAVPVGTYRLLVSVNDTSGNTNSSTLTIIVTDTTPPTLTLSNQTAEYAQPFAYQITATDDSGISDYWLTGTSGFSIGDTGIITNTSPIYRDAIYLLTISVNDTYNNTASATLKITVVDTTPPSPIADLATMATGKSWITWNWTNPADTDFNHAELWLDGLFYENTTRTTSNVTSLTPSTEHTLSIKTVDTTGNRNNNEQNSTTQTRGNMPPSITIHSPYNNSIAKERWRLLNFTISDTQEQTLCVSVYADNDTPSTGHLLYENCSYQANTTATINWSTPPMHLTTTTAALWHFDNNSQYDENEQLVHDFATSTSYDLTCSGTTCPNFAPQGGRLAGAYHYDPANNEQWQMTEQFFNDAFTQRSYQLWFKADDTSGTKYLYEEGGTTNGLAFKVQAGTIQAAARTSSIQHTISIPFTDTTNWHFLVVQYDTGNLSLYLDGTLRNSTDTSADFTSISAHSDEAGLGGPNSGGAFGTETGTFSGRIDEMRITTTPLAAADIASLYELNDNTSYYWTINATDGYEYTSAINNFLINVTNSSFIGNTSDIKGNTDNVTVTISGAPITDFDQSFTGTRNITITMNGEAFITFQHDFDSAPLNLTNITLYRNPDNSVAVHVPGHVNMTLYVPLNGTSCEITICDGVLNATSCDAGNTRYATPTPVNGLCPVLINGTYAKDRPDLTDFAVTDQDISFNPASPIAGQNVTINVTVANNGQTWATNVTVLITDNTTSTILTNYTIANFTAGSNQTIITWLNASAGAQLITVAIDPDHTYTESNETNNDAQAWLNISSWFTLYGHVNASIVLASDTNIFYRWSTAPTNGTIFATDADATIDWQSLQALTRAKDNTTATEDFAEADTALGTTGRTDSITNLFGQDNSTPKTTETLTINGKAIANVPYSNSTDNNNFHTAILWDTADAPGNEYTGTEDLLFTTTINHGAPGTYGTYDYELKIPAGLQTTVPGTDTTYLYVELN